MKRHSKSVRIALFALALMFVGVFAASASEDYSFKVHNNTKHAIKKILVSEDGKQYGYFDIGKGIKAGATEQLTWDKSTNGESCEQYFKAVFDNGEESEPQKFDFCEEDLTLEFE